MKLLSESLRRRKFIIWPGEGKARLWRGAGGGRRGGLCDPQAGSVAAPLPAAAGGAASTSAARPPPQQRGQRRLRAPAVPAWL